MENSLISRSGDYFLLPRSAFLFSASLHFILNLNVSFLNLQAASHTWYPLTKLVFSQKETLYVHFRCVEMAYST